MVNVDSPWWLWYLNGSRLSFLCPCRNTLILIRILWSIFVYFMRTVVLCIYSVYEPKHVARNKIDTANKLRVVFDYIIV
jgi:hypothetical protein